MDLVALHIESLIFCSPSPVTLPEIQSVLTETFGTELSFQSIEAHVQELLSKYSNEKYPFEIVHSGGGYQFLTKPAYQASISVYLKQKSKKRLSTSALETLAIIAYKQPITKSQVEQVRGVNCDYAIQKLLEKELIDIKGKADSVGKPVLYGVSTRFFDYFGINSTQDLPTLKDFVQDNMEMPIASEE